MKYKYNAGAWVLHSMDIEVEANDEDTAMELARNKLEMHYGENTKEFNQNTNLYDFDINFDGVVQ